MIKPQHYIFIVIALIAILLVSCKPSGSPKPSSEFASVSQVDSATAVEGVASVAPDMPVMMHIALGGQHDEAVFWLDNMIARGVKFDIIGISYYPRWHGTLDDLKYNLTDLANRYNKYLNVVEYAVFKKEVHDIVFNLPNSLGTGTCIWEPLRHDVRRHVQRQG